MFKLCLLFLVKVRLFVSWVNATSSYETEIVSIEIFRALGKDGKYHDIVIRKTELYTTCMNIGSLCGSKSMVCKEDTREVTRMRKNVDGDPSARTLLYSSSCRCEYEEILQNNE